MRELAMSARLRQRPPITEHVLTSNMDDVVLESLSEHLTSTNATVARSSFTSSSSSSSSGGSGGKGSLLDTSAVVVYQLLLQRWKSKPGVVAPRTLVLSEDRILLVRIN
jgi:hypothetical protein